MKFLRKPKPEEKSEGVEQPRADLSNILASLTMRLEQVERRLDALEGAPARPHVVSPPPPPALPEKPMFPRFEAPARPEVTPPRPPRLVTPRPRRSSVKKPKSRVKKPPKMKPPARPAPPTEVKPPAELKEKIERVEKVVRREKLEPVKLMRGKTIKPFKKKD